MAGVLAIDGGRNWRIAPVPTIRRRPRIPASHVALWLGGSLVRGFVRKHPYLSAGAAAAALGLGAYRYIRSRRVRKMTTTPRYGAKRPRVDDAVYEGPGGGYVNDRHFKRTRKLGRVNIRKLAKEGVHALYDRYQIMGMYGAQAGSRSFAKDVAAVAQDGSTGLANTVTTPVYLFDLSCSRNTQAGTMYVPNVGYQLVRETTTGNIYFNHLRSQNIATGVLGTDKDTVSYQYYQTPRVLSVLDTPLETGILDWVKCQFVFYGAKKTSHKIWVDVVQMDPQLQPKAQSTNLGVLRADPLSTAAVTIGCDEQTNTVDGFQWWTNELARLMDSPFATFGSKVKKLPFKILSRKTIEFTPVSSYEEAGAALCHKQTLNLFLKMGRKCDYGWRNDVAPGSSVLGDAYVETDVEAGQHSCYVHPKARVFLLLRSQVFNKVGDNAAFADNTDCAPSFDIRISRKFLVAS